MQTPTGTRGVRIDRISSAVEERREWKGSACPREGDILIELAGERVPTLHHFVQTLSRKLDRTFPPDRTFDDGADPSEQADEKKWAIVSIGKSDERWTRVEFYAVRSHSVQWAWIKLNPLPAGAILMSLAWFLMKMIIFVIGALVVWRRPGDLSANLFFVHSCITVVAFLGGFHWLSMTRTWILFWPMLACTMLVAPVTFHFFLSFPQVHPLARRWPWGSLVAIYSPSLICLVSLYVALGSIAWADYQASVDPALRPECEARIGELVDLTKWIGFAYIPIAALTFLLGQTILVQRFFRSPTAAERNQIKWILLAAVIATLPLSYGLFTAMFNWVEFSFGSTTQPLMFLASALYTVAFAVSITRYKLMESGRLLNRGFIYITVSLLAMAFFCLLLAVGTMIRGDDGFDWLNVLWVGLTSLVLQVSIGWFGDRLLKSSELRFHQEKYQLDNALRRLGDAVDQLLEPFQLVQQMLPAATNAVSAVRGAVYLRDDEDTPFERVAQFGTGQMPPRLDSKCPLVSALEERSVISLRPPVGFAEVALGGALSIDEELLADDQLADYGCKLAYSLEANGMLIGLVLLGPKEDDQVYTTEDRNFLLALARTTSLALHSARARHTMEDLQQELHGKVDLIAEQRQRILFLQGELSDRDAQAPPAAGNSSPSPDAPGTLTLRHELRGSSIAVQKLLREVAKISRSSSSVLIRGESGTGKELLARAIHQNSPRAAGPFVVVHCAALSQGLLESELFGHVKGAFTGADRDKIGRFEMADCGTLFLDEIGDISLETQTKLLRVLQEQAFERVGSVDTVRVDVRLISATHRPLEELIRQEKFREDVLYRLNVISLWAPPLRDRGDDVLELAFYFLRRFAQQTGKPLARIEKDALEALAAYHWPGNVRQLENVMERAVVLAEGESLTCEDLPPEVLAGAEARVGSRKRSANREANARDFTTREKDARENGAREGLLDSAPMPAGPDAPPTWKDALREEERRQLLDALAQCQGNKARAARLLGIPRSTLFSRLRKFGLE